MPRSNQLRPGVLAVITLVLAALTAPLAMAQGAERSFFGVGVANHRLYFDSDDREQFDVNTEEELGGQLRVGLIRPASRLYGQWTIISSSDFFISSLTVNADYLLRLTRRVQLYGGAGGGAVTLSWNGDNSIDTMPGASLQAGALIEVSPRVVVEIGARQLFTRLRTDPEGADGSSVDIDLDRMGVASVGVNLTF